MKTLRDPFVAIALLLAAAVAVEVLLFRIFARGGVYFIKDDTPEIVKSGYTSLVFMGNLFFNFAAPLVLLALAMVALRYWGKRETWLGPVVGTVLAAVAAHGALRILGVESSVLSIIYLGISALAILMFVAICAQGGSSIPIRSFVALAGLSYLFVYAFKVASGFAGVGWTPPIATTTLYSLGEWLAVAAFLALIPALRHLADRRSVLIGTGVAVLAMGMAAGRSESIPLIATWAFGLSLNLPYPVYVVALWVAIVVVVGSFRHGMPLVGLGVLLILFGHRTIPLTYFNDLALAGIAMVVLSLPTRGHDPIGLTKAATMTRLVRKPVFGRRESIREPRNRPAG